jgi:hypothetical protein
VLVGGLAWVALLFPLVFIVPKFQAIFADFDAQLPGITQAVLAATQAVGQLGFLFGALWVLVVGGLAIGLGSMRSRWGLALSGVFAALSFLAVMVLTMLLFVALFLPLVDLMTQVSRAH